MRLSTNFTLEEMIHSETAERYRIDNHASPRIIASLQKLVENVLQPARDLYGAPIRVNSSYRCETLNRAVGGAPYSQHVRGEAADITVGCREKNRRLFELIETLDYDQLIWEKGDCSGPDWIHVSYVGRSNRHKMLRL